MHCINTNDYGWGLSGDVVVLTIQNVPLEIVSPSKSLAACRAGIDLVCAAAAVATCTAYGRVHMDVHTATLVSS